jgi:hypothetical protein
MNCSALGMGAHGCFSSFNVAALRVNKRADSSLTAMSASLNWMA